MPELLTSHGGGVWMHPRLICVGFGAWLSVVPTPHCTFVVYIWSCSSHVQFDMIWYSVGKITPVPMCEVRHKDFGERAKISMYFPKKGSQLTPSHYSMDFYWKDHCPMVFRFWKTQSEPAQYWHQSQFDKSKRKERAREREIREKERERERAKEKEREEGETRERQTI
ncbi:phosphatidylinositol 4-phosphate 5-kinase 8-like protein isoform X1 [Tanacetum coccineum]